MCVCLCVCFKQPVEGPMLLINFNAVLGSLMLLTSFSHTTRPHHANLSVPNHSVQVHIIPFHILFLTFHSVGTHSKLFHSFPL